MPCNSVLYLVDGFNPFQLLNRKVMLEHGENEALTFMAMDRAAVEQLLNDGREEFHIINALTTSKFAQLCADLQLEFAPVTIPVGDVEILEYDDAVLWFTEDPANPGTLCYWMAERTEPDC